MRKFSYLVLVLFLSTIVYSLELTNNTPLGTNASSIAKYGEIPISYFTGIPNLNSPVYTIKYGDLALSLSLNSLASGNKVEAIASWVGLYWPLNTIPPISSRV